MSFTASSADRELIFCLYPQAGQTDLRAPVLHVVSSALSANHMPPYDSCAPLVQLYIFPFSLHRLFRMTH